MKTRNAVAASLLVWLGTLLLSAALWAWLPDRVPIHWNVHGQPDGFVGRLAGALLVPGMLLATILLMLALPAMSPKSFRIEPFRNAYNFVTVLLSALFGYIHLVSLWAAINPGMDSGRVLIGGMLIVFALLGNVMGKVRQNYWMGFRTPWTLSSNAVWISTHRLGARLVVATSVLGLALLILGAPFWLVFSLVMVGFLYPVLYSFLEYKRLERSGGV